MVKVIISVGVVCKACLYVSSNWQNSVINPKGQSKNKAKKITSGVRSLTKTRTTMGGNNTESNKSHTKQYLQGMTKKITIH